jgi:hypothetical protein
MGSSAHRRPRRGLVGTALCCYPQSWRARNGDEALEIAALLEQDGVPRSSIAWSYFKGAAWHRLVGGGTKGLRVPLGALAAAGSVVVVCVAMLFAPLTAGAVGRAPRPTTTVPAPDRPGAATRTTTSYRPTAAAGRLTCNDLLFPVIVPVELSRGDDGRGC